ncbi:xylose isomerase-like protein [Rostrohypoxylon terebratum]|nr:xylose isomerase-like protein [Rostrohypoxylon terebratum]
MYGTRDLSAADPAQRQATIGYMKNLVDMAAGLGAKVMTRGVREVALYAAEKNVRVAVEPLNQLETCLITNASQALRLIDDANVPNQGIAFDPFQMNIEEPDMIAALRRCSDKVFDFHLGDNNRLSPGDGNLDWPLIVETLREIGYKGGLAFEAMPLIDRTPNDGFGSQQMEPGR